MCFDICIVSLLLVFDVSVDWSRRDGDSVVRSTISRGFKAKDMWSGYQCDYESLCACWFLDGIRMAG